MTFAAYAARWLSLVKPRVEEETWQNYERSFRLRWLPRLGARPVAEITRVEIRAHLRELLASGRAANSVHADRTMLGACLQDAADDGVIPVNPARDAGRNLFPSPLVHRRQPLSLAEVQQLLPVCRQLDAALHLFVVVAVTGGLRTGEILALRWDDLDMGGGTVTVRRTRAKRIKERTKGRRASEIDLPAVVVRLLDDWRGEHAASRWVFENPASRLPYSQTHIRRGFELALARAGLPEHYTPHCLRHTCGTQVLAYLSTEAAQRHMRHATVAMTVDYYGASRVHRDRDAIERFGAHVLGLRQAASGRVRVRKR